MSRKPLTNNTGVHETQRGDPPDPVNAAEQGAGVARLLVLLTALLFVAMNEPSAWGSDTSLAVIVVIATFYVVATSISPLTSGDAARLNLLVTVTDTLLITSIVYETGGLHSPLYPLYYLPILQASIRLSLRDAIGASLLAIGLYFVLGFTEGLEANIPVRSTTRIVAFGFSATLVGLFLSLAMRETREHRRATLRATQLLTKMRGLVDVAAALSSTLELNEILGLIVQKAPAVMNAEAASIVLADEAAGVLRFRAASGPRAHLLAGRQMPLGSGLAGWVIEHDETVIVDTPETDPRFYKEILQEIEYPVRSLIVTPIRSAGKPIGCVEVLNKTGEQSFDDDDRRVLEAFSVHAALAIENAGQYETTKTEAITDPLTGLCNRRELEQRMAAELNHAVRYGGPVSVVMMDLDHFKRINDTYGHQAGDKVLREVAKLLRRLSRSSDVVARYGGEEFVMVLPHTGKQQAVEAAQRLRQAVESLRVWWAGVPEPLTITISCGVTSVRLGEDNAASVLARADRRLYQAKAEGRNRVCAEDAAPVAQSQS